MSTEDDLIMAQVKQEAIMNFLSNLAARYFSEDLGTYDYDGIAEEVLSYVR